MKYGPDVDIKENEESSLINTTLKKPKFVTFKSSMRGGETMQTTFDERPSGPIKPHVNPKRHLIKPRPDKKEPTFIPKEMTLKKAVRHS